MSPEEKSKSSSSNESENITQQLAQRIKRRWLKRKKVCRFCSMNAEYIDYKDVDILKDFITETGKIIPRRLSGNCAKHQRKLANAIKKARIMALMPFVIE